MGVRKCACAFRLNAHFNSPDLVRIYHDSSKCACANDFVFSPAPGGAVSYQEGGNKEPLSSERGMLYRLNLKTIYNLVRSIGDGAGGGCRLGGSKLKSNAHAHLAGRVHGPLVD